uniref:Uncharacterized protein n=1 Tax=viral metagenome TaxID=1070528 RepID=A0A6C0ED49_9ZZZZ
MSKFLAIINRFRLTSEIHFKESFSSISKFAIYFFLIGIDPSSSINLNVYNIFSNSSNINLFDSIMLSGTNMVSASSLNATNLSHSSFTKSIFSL